MWIVYLIAGGILVWEGISRYQNRPSKQQEDLYEDARRTRIRHLAQRGDVE